MSRKPGTLRTLALLLGLLAVRWPRLVLVTTLAIIVALAAAAARIDQDDDVTRFLPGDDPEVERFDEIGRRFGGLSIAIVGLEVAGEGDLFDVERLRLLRELDAALAALPGVNATTSFTELPDIVERETADGRTRADLHDLVGNVPPRGDPTATAFADDVRERAMAREHIVGSLVSDDGAATILLCQIDPDASMKPVADSIRQTTLALLAEHPEAKLTAHFGGAPFIGSYAAENTRRDLIALSPWVVVAVVGIMLITSRSVPAVAIALFTVAAGIVVVMGGLVLAGRNLTLVSSSLPVLLVALGSAYAVHLLAATLAALDQHVGSGRIDRAAREDAVQAALFESGPPVLVAGLTTCAGFASFLVMDVAPMREFGLLMALATVAIVVMTLLVVPAACVVLPLRPRAEGRAPGWALAAMSGMATTVMRHRTVALVALGLVTAAAAFGASKVRAHTDIRTLFAEDSEPVRAERFLEDRFGGSLFLQLEVAGDIKHPAVLRQIERIAAAAGSIDGVSRVQSVVTAVNLASSATTGEPRIPPRRETAAALGELVLSDPSARLLVDEPWQHTLLQVQLSTFDISRARAIAAELARVTEPLVGARLVVARSALDDAARQAELTEVLEHVAAIVAAEGLEPPPREVLAEALGAGALDGLRSEVATELRYNLIDDPMVELADAASLEAITERTMAWIAAGTFDDAAAFSALLAEHVAPEERADAQSLRQGTDFVFGAVKDIVDGRLRTDRVEAVMARLGELPRGAGRERLRAALERALWTLSDDVAFVPVAPSAEGAVELSRVVSGYPLMYAAMNDSVERNQWGSLLVSAALVVAVLALFYRSLGLALVALVPAGFTLLVTFGVMGFLRIPMDIGTSMIAAIALGVGIDYAVHLLWRYGRPAPEEAPARLRSALGATGWGIVINALEVSVGLVLLLFGTIVPMRNFGLLAALAMLVGALCTLALVPALAIRTRRGAEPVTNPPAAST